MTYYEIYLQVSNAAPTRNQNMLSKLSDKMSDVEKGWEAINSLASPIKIALQNAIDAEENKLAAQKKSLVADTAAKVTPVAVDAPSVVPVIIAPAPVAASVAPVIVAPASIVVNAAPVAVETAPILAIA